MPTDTMIDHIKSDYDYPFHLYHHQGLHYQHDPPSNLRLRVAAETERESCLA